jgi:hypothetical protein
MKSKKLSILPLTRHHVIEAHGVALPYSVKGWTVIDDSGCVAGIGGVMLSSPLQCFSIIRQPLKDDKRTLIKVTRLMRQLLNTFEATVYAFPDKKEPTAMDFLPYVGFQKINDEVFVWQPR